METLEEAQARVAELETQVTSLSEERDAAVSLGEQLRVQLGETAGQRDASVATVAELTTARTQLGEAQSAVVAATRRALLAEHAGQVVPELVTGETVEALEASVEGARSAFSRAAEAARAAAGGAPPVPAGAGSARTRVSADGMTPLQMVTAGLTTRGGQ